MHADGGELQRPGQRARHPGADQQRADQAGPCGVGHAIEVGDRHPRLAEGLPDQRQQLAHVVAAGQFRDHAAIFGMQGDLAVDRVGTQPGSPRQASVIDRYAGLIAGSFDTKDAHGLDLGAAGRE